LIARFRTNTLLPCSRQVVRFGGFWDYCMTVWRIFLLSSLAGFLGLAVLTLSGTAKEFQVKSLRIGYQKSATVLALAREKKLFEKALAPLGIQSVQWIEFQYGPPLLEALGSGAIDLGAVGDTPPIFSQSAGADILYLAAYPQEESAFLVLDDSEIKKPEQLKGKKIAVSLGSSAHNFMLVMLEKYGLRLEDITPVYLAPADAIAAIITKRIDAWVIWDPYVTIAVKNHHARKLISTISDNTEYNSFYILNSRFAIMTPKITQAIYDALSHATIFVNENRDGVANLISGLTGIAYDIQRSVLKRTTFNLLAIDEEVLKRQQEIANRFFRLGLITHPVQISDIVWRRTSNIY